MSRETIQTLNTNVLVGFTSKRGKAWHYKASEQGTEPNHYENEIPVADVQRRLFNFDVEPWDVAISPRLAHDADEATRLMREWKHDPNRVAWVRNDTQTALEYFKPGYTGHAYDQWLLQTVATLGLPIGSAGVLRGGAIAWVQAEMPENVDTTVGMSYRPNFLATTSFDGSVKTTFKRTFTVAVCDNTVRIALAESGPTFAVAHRRNSLERLAEAPVALGLLDEASTAFTAHITKLSQQVVTDRQWARFLDRWTPVVDASGNELSKRAVTFATNKRDKLEKLWLDDPRVSPWKNTALGVSQAINTFTHHETAVRGDRVERNMLNTILGHTQTVDNDAARVLSLVLA